MKIKAHGKVNLALDILGVREDGKHEMDMVNAPINLCDEIELEPNGKEIDEVFCDNELLPPSNTLSHTLKALRKHGLKEHYTIHLTKVIPMQAGLGGGSADAAALLWALDELEDLQLSLPQLEEIGFEIGADVPCCLHNDFTRVQGAGERVTDLEVDWSIPVLLVQGKQGISTAQAFANFDAAEPRPLDIDIVQDAVRKRDIGLLYQTMTNAFEGQAFAAIEELAQMKEDMQDAGLVRVMMTGSGSCLMGFSVDDEVLEDACETLRKKYPFVWKGKIGL
ncbi:4-(cytidine 5'-diphospho)-2-C-methyl-D-erythritol kinase [Erysipelotrichaceae bacterium 51-3]